MPKVILAQDSDGTTRRVSMDDYICQCVLELLETIPFRSLTVRDITERAQISRSAFYNHFDSIYGAVQKIEDDFFQEFYPMEPALEMMIKHDLDTGLSLLRLADENSQVIRVLSGPNGDPYFSYKLQAHLEKVCLEYCRRYKYEVKSSIIRSRKTFTAHGFYQLPPGDCPKYLLFCQLEASESGLTIDGLADDLVNLGYSENVLNEGLERLGYSVGMSARRTPYSLLSMAKYAIDEAFPHIDGSSFVSGGLPDGVEDIDYTVSLDSVEGVDVLAGVEELE